MKAKRVKYGDWIQVKSMKEKTGQAVCPGCLHLQQRTKGAIDQTSEIIQLGLEDEIIEKVGNSYIYETLDGEELKLTEAKLRERMNRGR
jgi:hypothetical protein